MWSHRSHIFSGRGSDQLGQMPLAGDVRSRLKMTIGYKYWRTLVTLIGAAFDS